MPSLDDWETWMQEVVREVQNWLHSRDTDIDLAPRESRRDTRIGQIWRGRKKRFNIVCYHRLENEFRIELLLSRDLSDQLEKELQKIGLAARYTDENRRLNIPVTQDGFERNKNFFRRIVDTTYEQAIEPRL